MDSRQEQKLKDLNASLNDRLKAIAIELQSKNRELEVEAALEMVRIRATAMRISSELAETSAVLFQQLNELNIKAIRIGVGIFDDANDAMEIWLTTFSDSQEVIRILDYVNLHIHPVYENIIPARKQNNPYAVTILEGEQVRRYYQTMSTYLSLPEQQQFNPREYFYSFFFSDGTINVISLHVLTDEECNIMIRVSQVFGLIYTRFLDLQKAEAQARDVKKQSSLDRVRGQIASMRSTTDLQSITPLIWNELKTLGVPFIRCGVFIIDEKTEIVQVYLSSPDGHSLAVLKLPFQINAFIVNAIEYWRKKVYTGSTGTKMILLTGLNLCLNCAKFSIGILIRMHPIHPNHWIYILSLLHRVCYISEILLRLQKRKLILQPLWQIPFQLLIPGMKILLFLR